MVREGPPVRVGRSDGRFAAGLTDEATADRITAPVVDVWRHPEHP